MWNYKKIIIGLAVSGTLALAADATGTVSATKGLQLNGQAVPVAGTKQWPVGTGDDLRSDASPVVLTMKDGSRIVLGKYTQARLEAQTLRLMAGTMRYELAPQSSLQVAVKDNILESRTGVATTVVNAVAPVALTPTTELLPPISRRKP